VSFIVKAQLPMIYVSIPPAVRKGGNAIIFLIKQLLMHAGV